MFDINIPSIGLSATGLHADGIANTLSDGSKVILSANLLTFTAVGAWAYAPAGAGTSYLGISVVGSYTPIANIPTTGSATYTGSGATGGVTGAYFVPSGTGTVSAGSLTGDFSMTANFASNVVVGTLSNMMATPAGGGTATSWNTVSLSAIISRLPNFANFIGNTTTTAAPAGAGAAGFSSAATGGLGGGFFGPNMDEVGGTWTLTDPNAAGGGKTAFGAFAGVK
jgi:hypothetical protein